MPNEPHTEHELPPASPEVVHKSPAREDTYIQGEKKMPPFHSARHQAIGLTLVVKDIVAYIIEEPRARYDVIIGTDSQGRVIVDFVTAIVVHRVGHGGRYFWQRSHKGPIHSLREKLYTETMLSIETAERFTQLLKEELAAHPSVIYNFEIHVDAGENGPTRDVLREVVGMVRGYGYYVRTKPQSYCASSVADRHA